MIITEKTNYLKLIGALISVTYNYMIDDDLANTTMSKITGIQLHALTYMQAKIYEILQYKMHITE